MKINGLKVALVHDWLTYMRGAERCLESFCEIFPDADIFTLVHKKGSVSKTIESHNINTSFLQKFPYSDKIYRYLYTLMPTAIEQFDFREYDLVLSGSSCVAKGVIVPHNVLHISYIYSPMRYSWEMYPEYFGEKSQLPWWQRMVIPPQINYIRMWDVASSNRVDYFVADSKHVADRIEKIYRRKSDVIYPPVDTDIYKLNAKKEDFYLVVTGFEPNKRTDLAVGAFNKLKLPLKVVGSTGRFMKSLQKTAGKNIEFLGWQSDNEVRDLYGKARAVIFPGVDDFGIVPLEAMASGTPVIAYAAGGALETVIPSNPPVGRKYRKKPTGTFFYQPTVHSLLDAVKKFRHYDRTKGWDRMKMRKYALGFNKRVFEKNIKGFVEEKMMEFEKSRGRAKVYEG